MADDIINRKYVYQQKNVPSANNTYDLNHIYTESTLLSLSITLFTVILLSMNQLSILCRLLHVI